MADGPAERFLPQPWHYERTHLYTTADRVVVAVTEDEVGHEEVEWLIAGLASWSFDDMMDKFYFSLLDFGRVINDEDGELTEDQRLVSQQIYKDVLCFHQKDWAVVKLEPDSEFVRTHWIPLYAILNVGKEGWCVLTMNIHTVLHVLRNVNIQTNKLMEGPCGNDCVPRQYNLVPRMTLPHKLLNLLGYFYFTLGLCWIGNLVEPFDFSLFRKQYEESLETTGDDFYYYFAYALSIDFNYSMESLFVNQVSEDLERDWFLFAGFDVHERKHKARSVCKITQNIIWITKAEHETLQYLMALRQLLRPLKREMVKEFLRNFTRANPVKWEEAATIIYGVLTLQTLALQPVSRLPQEYLRQHAPPAIYRTITRQQMLGQEPRLQEGEE